MLSPQVAAENRQFKKDLMEIDREFIHGTARIYGADPIACEGIAKACGWRAGVSCEVWEDKFVDIVDREFGGI